MKIAIPTHEGNLTQHFGHCQYFTIFNVDKEKKEILAQEEVDAPPHQPGLLPVWLAQKDVDIVIAGGMGQRAQNLFVQNGIDVLVGAPAIETSSVIRDYLHDSLLCGANGCDH